MSRRSKHSPGADGLPLLETNEEAGQKNLMGTGTRSYLGGIRVMNSFLNSYM